MEHLRRFLVWFINGLGLGAGVAVIAWASTKFHEQERTVDALKSLPSSSVAISQVEPIAITEQVAAAAVLENKSTSNLGVEVQLALVKDSKVLYTCERHAPSVPGPGKSQRIQVECRGVNRSSVPSGTAYEVRVWRVWVVS